MHSKPKQTIGRKRKLDEADFPACKRLKTSHKRSPNAMNINKMKQELFDKYHTKFPWTFFKFWEWIKSITTNNKNPLNIFNDLLNIKLVGPFEYIHGDLNDLSDSQILIHYRYYFDLPEFQTIMIENNSINNIHYGFWRDDPNTNPIGICKSDGITKVNDKNTKMIHPMACNLFCFIKDMISNNTQKYDDDNKERLKFIETSLNEFILKNKIKLNDKNKSFKEREKLIVTKTFHGFGLVVPFKNDIGYRPIGYTVNELKKILKRMNNNKIKNRKIDSVEMEYILTNICLADDEGDPGMGLEVGINLFYSYPMFINQAKRLLINGYQLTNRDEFELILNAHLEVRGKQNGKYNQILNVKKKKKMNNQIKDGNSNNNKKNNDNDDDDDDDDMDKQKITKFFAKKKKKENKKVVTNSLDDLSSDSD